MKPCLNAFYGSLNECTISCMQQYKLLMVAEQQILCISVLAKERKSGVPPVLGIRFSFDVVERM